MNKMGRVRQGIYTLLKTAHPRIWFQRAPKNAQFPYVTFDLPNSYDDGSVESFVLDVDGWDMPANGDSTDLETMMGAVDGALNGAVVTSEYVLYGLTMNGFFAPAQPYSVGGLSVLKDLTLRILLDNRLAPQEDDPKIMRRTYVYQVKVFERRE
jgi:hypothetical protein